MLTSKEQVKTSPAKDAMTTVNTTEMRGPPRPPPPASMGSTGNISPQVSNGSINGTDSPGEYARESDNLNPLYDDVRRSYYSPILEQPQERFGDQQTPVGLPPAHPLANEAHSVSSEKTECPGFINLEMNQNCGVSGQSVFGRMKLKIKRDIKVLGMEVEFVGEEILPKKSGNRLITKIRNNIVQTPEMEKSSGRSIAGRVSKGTYIVPFSLRLPEKLPSSFSVSGYKVEYTLGCRIASDEGVFAEYVRFAIVESESASPLPEPQLYSAKGKFFWGGGREITLFAQLQNASSICSGDPIILKIAVDNLSSKKLNLSVNLKRKIVPKNNVNNTVTKTLKHQKYKGHTVRASEKREFCLVLDDYQRSFSLALTELFTVVHEIEVIASPTSIGFGSEVKLSFPITLKDPLGKFAFCFPPFDSPVEIRFQNSFLGSEHGVIQSKGALPSSAGSSPPSSPLGMHIDNSRQAGPLPQKNGFNAPHMPMNQDPYYHAPNYSYGPNDLQPSGVQPQAYNAKPYGSEYQYPQATYGSEYQYPQPSNSKPHESEYQYPQASNSKPNESEYQYPQGPSSKPNESEYTYPQSSSSRQDALGIQYPRVPTPRANEGEYQYPQASSSKPHGSEYSYPQPDARVPSEDSVYSYPMQAPAASSSSSDSKGKARTKPIAPYNDESGFSETIYTPYSEQTPGYSPSLPPRK
eukprot:Nk52_evm24s248 gene=Nk52_evmTU24s248